MLCQRRAISTGSSLGEVVFEFYKKFFGLSSIYMPNIGYTGALNNKLSNKAFLKSVLEFKYGYLNVSN